MHSTSLVMWESTGQRSKVCVGWGGKFYAPFVGLSVIVRNEVKKNSKWAGECLHSAGRCWNCHLFRDCQEIWYPDVHCNVKNQMKAFSFEKKLKTWIWLGVEKMTAASLGVSNGLNITSAFDFLRLTLPDKTELPWPWGPFSKVPKKLVTPKRLVVGVELLRLRFPKKWHRYTGKRVNKSKRQFHRAYLYEKR